jgi:hypothetical protein
MSVQTDRQTWWLSRVVLQWMLLIFFNILNDNYRITEAANDSESTTMIRLKEQHVKAGSAR